MQEIFNTAATVAGMLILLLLAIRATRNLSILLKREKDIYKKSRK